MESNLEISILSCEQVCKMCKSQPEIIMKSGHPKEGSEFQTLFTTFPRIYMAAIPSFYDLLLKSITDTGAELAAFGQGDQEGARHKAG